MSLRFKGGVISSVPPTTSGTPYTGLAKGVWSLEDQIQAKAAGLWPRAIGTPEAPTIGIALSGNTLVTVAYTAPADNGGSTITSYTATSSPGNISATGTTSPITVTGLTNGTVYTFTVVANNAYGSSAPSAASTSVTPAEIPVIGSVYGGGFFAGQISTTANGVATHNLVVGTPSSTQYIGFQWATAFGATGLTSVIDGPGNSAAMNSASYPAAQFCESVNAGGFTDWYMPAKNELEVCYYNLKPEIYDNNTYYGSNANSVPKRTGNYTTSIPAQTSAVDFRDYGANPFTTNYYWSSTEYDSNNSTMQRFFNGGQYPATKTATYPAIAVRAIRRVAI